MLASTYDLVAASCALVGLVSPVILPVILTPIEEVESLGDPL